MRRWHVPANDKTGSILAFLIGLGIGVSAALLLAPQAGDELRDDIGDAIDDSMHQLRRHGRKIGRHSRKLIDAVQDTAEDVVQQAKDVADQVKKARA